MKTMLYLLLTVTTLSVFGAVPQYACVVERTGCCSSHGGACGCEKGRVKCCDGALSPSCRCRSDRI